jgi:putative protein-disulfide isomerase
MIASNEPAPFVLYVMDAYCGWCYGFSSQLREFEAANRHRIAFKVISGGLFIGDRARPFSAYPYIADANARITEVTGARFGEPYQQLLVEGSFVMNSADAATGFAALRAVAPERGIHVAHRLQDAFYSDGRSLSAPHTIVDIARSEGLDSAQVYRLLAGESAHKEALSDFSVTRQLGVSSYPTLLFINGAQVHSLPATGATLEVLNARLDALMG